VDFDVAILGGGPTGLSLANLLGVMGVRTVLIERNESTVQAPRAVSIDDECLRTISQILKSSLGRAHDLVARYGGEEFACILPNCPFLGAKALAENEKQIVSEFKAVQGKPVDIGGYYMPAPDLLQKAMCPSATFNKILQSANA
jgi:glycerol-3-phosphate dehydrogenase